ncbi:MAG: GH3 auxin-responsive promoter family protein [Promethearchaeota archaeon]
MDKLENPVTAQEACLRKVLKRCKNTAYGKEHGFTDIKSVEEFQHRVPVTSYKQMYPYITRCMKGEQNILFPDKIVYFMATSGTTGSPKYHPLGEYRLRVCTHESVRRAIFYVVHGNHYDLLDGATINLHGSLSTGEKIGPYDVAYVSGALAAAFTSQQQNTGGLGATESSRVIPPYEVRAMSDWDKKIYLTARYAVAADVRITVGISTIIVSLFRKLHTKFYDRLITDPELDNETKAKLRRVSKHGVINLGELWPNFTIFGTSGISITPFRRIIRDLLGDVEIWDVYGATEGTLGAQIYPEGGIVAAVDRTFFEFQPNGKDTKPIPLSEVKINTPYQILITNNAGFYRYSLGDLVTFASLDPPEFGEITRMKTFVNIVGERVTVEMLLRALDHACEQQDTSFIDFALLPEITKDITRYQLFVEFTQIVDNLEEFAGAVDSHLRSAGMYYNSFRKNSVLSPPRIIPVRPGGFEALLRQLGKDPLLGKVPRLLTPEISRMIPRWKFTT